MKFNLFPPVFKIELDDRTQQKIKDEQDRSANQQDELKKISDSKPDAFTFIIGVGFVGFCIGFFICVATCFNSVEEASLSDTLGPWVLFTLGGMILGGILYGISSSSYEENLSEVNGQLSSEVKYSEEKINQIKANAQKEYMEYVANFERTAQQMSVQFAESQLATEVIDWMTDGYIKTIEAADRRSHIESVNIPFDFNVYTSKITCNLGTFDFEIKRCRNLTSPTEQTALARAIASAIQLNITMKYPKDISGTDIITNIDYTYGIGSIYESDYVSATITYTAHNGNYSSVRDWN